MLDSELREKLYFNQPLCENPLKTQNPISKPPRKKPINQTQPIISTHVNTIFQTIVLKYTVRSE